MPETSLRLRWPDTAETDAYSPSSIVRNFFHAGESYQLNDFLARARLALTAASARVQEIYGMPCARAHATLAGIEARASAFADLPDATITLLEFR